MDSLKDRLDELKKKYLENEINVQKAELEASSAESLADRAESVSLSANTNHPAVVVIVIASLLSSWTAPDSPHQMLHMHSPIVHAIWRSRDAEMRP